MKTLHNRSPRTRLLGAAAILLALAVLLLGACSAKEDHKDKPKVKNLTVQVTGNPTTLAAGRAIVAIHLGLTSCDGTATTGINHTADSDITIAGGPVNVNFTLSSKTYPKAYLESYYLDVDNSNSLTNGDIVWGTNPNDLAGVCFTSITDRPAVDTLAWSDAETYLGTIPWAGGPQTFSDGDNALEDLNGDLPITVLPLERSYTELAQ